MADLNSSLESSGLSAEETTTIATTTAGSTSTAAGSSCEAMLWEGWSSNPSSSTTDETSTSNIALLPELATPTSSTLRYPHHSDMLCNLLSSFHPLAVPPQTFDDNATFLHQLDHADSEATTASFGEPSKAYLTGIPYPMPKRDDQISQWKASQWAQTVPESREFMKWDANPWPGTTTIQLFHNEDDTSHMRDDVVTGFGQTHQTSKKLELFSSFGTVADHHSEMNPVLMLSPQINQTSSIPWIPNSTPDRVPDRVPELMFTRSQQLLDFVRTAQDLQLQHAVTIEPSEQVPVTSFGVDSRKQNRRVGDDVWNAPASKRLHGANELAGMMMWRNQDSREDFAIATGMRRVVDCSPGRSGGVWSTNGVSSSSSISSPASQAMELFAMGPALNTNGKPRARRGSATDPQSVYARHRREKINERLKILQHLVPNGTKVDIVTMLDEAVHYVHFLKHQVKLLSSDTSWPLATPNVYKGIDLTNQHTQVQGMGSSAQGDKTD